MMDWLLFYFTRKQKSRRFTSAKSHSPQENIWLALRESKEKAAHAGDNSEICPLLAQFYNRARTYFSANA